MIPSISIFKLYLCLPLSEMENIEKMFSTNALALNSKSLDFSDDCKHLLSKYSYTWSQAKFLLNMCTIYTSWYLIFTLPYFMFTVWKIVKKVEGSILTWQKLFFNMKEQDDGWKERNQQPKQGVSSTCSPLNNWNIISPQTVNSNTDA